MYSATNTRTNNTHFGLPPGIANTSPPNDSAAPRQHILNSTPSWNISPLNRNKVVEKNEHIYSALMKQAKLGYYFPEQLKLIYVELKKGVHFHFSRKEKKWCRDAGWQGNFYDKKWPSPKQLDPHYKERPYRTTSTIAVHSDLNGKVHFAETNHFVEDQAIYCRHLATKKWPYSANE